MGMLTEMVGTYGDDGYTSGLTQKWSKFLAGVNDPSIRRATAMVYESEYKYLNGLNEDTLSTAVGPIMKYIYPLLMNVIPNLIAHRIVSVQPMTAPIGGIFFYDHKYQDDKGNVSAGDTLVKQFNAYYTSEFVDYHEMVAAASVDGVKKVWDGATNSADRKALTWLPVHPKDAAKEYVMTVTFTVGGSDVTLTDDGAGNLNDAGGVTRGTIDYTTGVFTLSLVAPPDAGKAIWATYYYESEKVSATSGAKIPSMGMSITLREIKAKTRKLRFAWSSEAADDLRAMHGKEAEAELVAAAANEISLELDREIIDDLVNGAAHSTTWAYGPAFGGANVLTEMDAIRSLLTKVDAVSAAIHKTTKRGPGNFLVVSTAIGALLSQLTSHGDFVAAGPATKTPISYGPTTSNFGVTLLGTLNNKYMVYQDPFIANDQILVGLVGKSYLDAGYVWSPYVALQATQTFQDPDTMMYKKGLRTRYAATMLRPEFYGKVIVSGLPTVTTTLP